MVNVLMNRFSAPFLESILLTVMAHKENYFYTPNRKALSKKPFECLNVLSF